MQMFVSLKYCEDLFPLVLISVCRCVGEMSMMCVYGSSSILCREYMVQTDWAISENIT